MRGSILGAPPGDRIDLLRDFVRQRVVRVLRRDATDPPDRHDRLTDLGLDSLMAVQLRGKLGSGAWLRHRAAGDSNVRLSHDRQVGRLPPAAAVPRGGAFGGANPQAVAEAPTPLGPAAVAAMTDAEIEALLSRRLERRPSLEQTNVFSNGA